MSIGINVIDSLVVVVIEYVLVNVSGVNNCFFCVFSVKIGMKESVIISSEKNNVGLILVVDLLIIF